MDITYKKKQKKNIPHIIFDVHGLGSIRHDELQTKSVCL